MSKLLLAVCLVVAAGTVYARCSTQTVNMNGKMTVCTTCCDPYGNCNTTCF
jgi:hypothetical protein